VLGAFHTGLREPHDQTERCLRALRHPRVDVLAHPRGRRYDRRVGIRADWERMAEEAARQGKALEIDASPDRQDLNPELLPLVREAGGWVAIDTDAHAPGELGFIVFGLAAAILAGIPRDRVLNLLPADEVVRWAER
ncbi:MAG TPA: histidinol-phosphatase, partial [Actinomycetota bacterium]|nr:histidinol-phosphatase [Actinomycetota bacterium]